MDSNLARRLLSKKRALLTALGLGESQKPQRQPVPIIVGAPRSGTTLLRFMLDAHPEMAIPPETGFFWFLPELTQTGDQLRTEFFNTITHYPPGAACWADFEISEDTLMRALNEIQPFSAVEGLRAFYRLYASRFNKPRWGDKTPLYCKSIPFIRGLLPEARFIHIIRDGRDAALSLRKMWFSPGWEIETQASYWRDCVSAARQAGMNHSDYLEIRYEGLILDTENTLKQICSFIDLSYDDAMTRYYTQTPQRLQEHKGRRDLNGEQFLTQEQRIQQQARTMNPPDPSLIFRWKAVMSADDQKRFLNVAGDLLEVLGYEV